MEKQRQRLMSACSDKDNFPRMKNERVTVKAGDIDWALAKIDELEQDVEQLTDDLHFEMTSCN